jgi:nucleoside-diphosphate-sugar epimerase
MKVIVGTDLRPIYKETRAGDVKHSQADISKAQRILGYTPLVTLEDGLRHTLDWCRSEAAEPAGR